MIQIYKRNRTPRIMLGAALITAGMFSLSAQFDQPAPRPKQPWDNTGLTADQRADLLLQALTLDEKIQLVHGAGLQGFGPVDSSIVRSNGGGGFVPGIPRVGIPDLNMDDSAVGVGGGAAKGRYSTALPSTVALASSWDPALAHEYGALMGSELAAQGYNVSLAGGVDIAREPRNGRTFEYQGEDPILAGNMVAELIKGMQGQGVIGDIKHYAVNDEETGRYFSNSVIGKRALREGDLLAFEIGVRKAHPGMVMCSYNLINGVYACENDYTLNQVLKKEWGFQGWVISDWFGTHSTSKAALAGLDQEQPSFSFFGPALKKAVEDGEVPLARLNDMVHRILRTEFAIGIIDRPNPTKAPDVFHGFDVAQRVEEASAVLLKNDGRQLPLDARSVRSIAVIGSHADVGVLSGGGSAQVSPAGGNAVPTKVEPGIVGIFSAVIWHPSSPLKAIRAHAPHAAITFDAGTNIAAAARAAKGSELAIVFLHQHLHEGGDVQTLTLPDAQDALVDAVITANPHTIVVLETGSAVSMPWASRVPAVLEAWYPGIRDGEAIANILFGDVNPSGKLALTFARGDADLPHPALPAPPGGPVGPLDGIVNTKPPFDVNYSEGLKAGYKWFDAENKAPLFAFGHGLSYTTFAYSDLKATGGQNPAVSLRVRNTGKRAGAETAQVYLAFPPNAGEPPKRLIGWQKVQLAPDEAKTLTIPIDLLYVSVFNTEANHWEVLPGNYQIMAGPSSRDLPLQAAVTLGQ